MQASYISRQTPIFASEVNSFRMELVLEDEVQSLIGVDIAVTVFTGQLSPRLLILSKYQDWVDGKEQNEDAYIARDTKNFTVVMAPEFLKNLPTGILTLSVTYAKDKMRVTNVIVTEKFINDLPECAQAQVM